MILQITDTLKEVGSVAKEQGQNFALLAMVLIAAGIFTVWLVKYLLRENSNARTEFLAQLDKRDEIMHTRTEKIW